MAEEMHSSAKRLDRVVLTDDSRYFAGVRVIKLELSSLFRYLRSKCMA